MKNLSKVLWMLSGALFVFFTLLPGVFSQTDGNIRYSVLPPSNAESAAPTVMLVMSRDHQYFLKAYNDYTDLDPENNNGIETSYSNTIQYFGYFQPDICYEYDSGIFEPKQLQNTLYYCDDIDTSYWSGNFLNWASMTRMDIVRRVLYGGKRIVDTGTRTVLERAYLPPDSHSFVKYYNGTDIARLTPFSGITNNGDGFDDQNEGISICNVTQFDSGNMGSSGESQTNTAPPVMRIAEGNYRMWTSNERVMCNWRDRNNYKNDVPSISSPRNMTVGGVNTGDFTFEAQTYSPVTNAGDSIAVSSGVDSYPDSPNTTDALTDDGDIDIIVRVASCESDGSGSAIDIESCKEYPDNGSGDPAFKPVGLLQDFGDDGSINFGLMTGSYTNNLEGGALRSNVKDFSDEVNIDVDGTFNRNDSSMVRAIDAFRIYGYRYGASSYAVDCGGNRSDISDRTCRAWGNPISEIYRDTLLYLAGKTTPTHSVVSDSTYISDVANTPAWTVPVNSDNQCTPLSTVVFNSSVNNYDKDAGNISIVGLGAPATVDSWTNQVGVGEGINGNNYYVGKNGTDNSEVCTAKTVSQLSDVSGVCPEGPSREGGYALAGLSYYANQTDLYDGATGLDGVQNVETYGVALASSLPVIEVPVSSGTFAGETVTLIPAGRQFSGGEGSLVNFQVVQNHVPIPGQPNKFFGKFFVTYEVAVAGNDHDIDASGTIEYVLDEASDNITVTTTTLTESAGSTAGLFGFVIDGTTQNGFHAYSGDAGPGGGANYTSTAAGVPGCSNCRSLVGRANFGSTSQYGPRSHTFALGSGAASLLEPPLLYASKWGKFRDLNGNNQPDLQEEWDKEDNNTGALTVGGDGLPDNYFFVTNPSRLKTALGNTFKKILADTQSSGTAPANLANADGSGGLIVQALYFDTQTSPVVDDESVNWTGQLEAFFIDEFGNFREDNPSSGTRYQLDGYDVDKVFNFDFDSTLSESLRVVRFDLEDPTKEYNPADPDVDYTACGTPANTIDCPNELDPATADNVPARELNTLWSAGDSLSSFNNAEIINQRDYSTAEAGAGGPGRHIISWFDKNRNRQVDDGEQIDFVRGSAALKDDQDVVFGRYLTGGNNLNQARRIIDFVRGKEGLTNMRSRSITELDALGNPVNVVKRLGDIVNSTPLIVGAPDSAYNALFGDPTYDDFLRKYNNRRQVMYIGGNDGLLHAFNVGFRKSSLTSALSFSSVDPVDASKTEHALGAELWAYAPTNLLPHLRWLTQPLYQHVFYVDGEPKSYDVNIFTPDEDHPNGWGTILVVGMRLGGGQFGVKLDGDNANDLEKPGQPGVRAGCGDWCARSSYVVLDITNPEKPPTVLAEINDNLLATFDTDGQVDLPVNSMQHTVTAPTLVKKRVPSAGVNFISPSVNEWKLVFGNGVQSRDNFNTGQSAKLYTYDLVSKSLSLSTVTGAGVPKGRSFVGGLTSVDWNGDFQDDMVYFGTVSASSSANDVDNFRGGLFRYNVGNGTSNAMFNANRPISVEPIARKLRGRQMLYFGSGRYYHQNDDVGDGQESFYALKEPIDTSSGIETYANNNVQSSKIVDSTNIAVDEDGNLSGSGAPAGITTFTALQNEITNNSDIHGWRRDLDLGTVAAPSSERVSTDAETFRTQLFYTSFIPDPNLCSVTSGESFLTAVDLLSGTASVFGALGFDGVTGEAITRISTGKGRASSPQLVISSGRGSNKGTIIIQQDTGELKNPSVITGAKMVAERINWREIRSD